MHANREGAHSQLLLIYVIGGATDLPPGAGGMMKVPSICPNRCLIIPGIQCLMAYFTAIQHTSVE